ncbi:MAG: hypothetical protein ACI9MR_000227 [Myxococcota bacterium]|jgi:hypothetical protein
MEAFMWIRPATLCTALTLLIPLATTGCGEDAKKADPAVVAAVDTRLDPVQFAAGGSTTVQCIGLNHLGEPLPGSWSLLVTPSQGVQIAGLTLSTTRAGLYDVACQDTAGAVDTTPAILTVTPDAAVATQMLVTPDTATAGEPAALVCHTLDVYGNVRGDDATFVDAMPGEETPADVLGFETLGDEAQAFAVSLIAGQWTLTCDANGIAVESLGTAPFTVVAGPAVGRQLAFKPRRVAYALDTVVIVEGVTVDENGNPREGENFAITNLTATPSTGFEIVGNDMARFKFSVEGFYTAYAEAVDRPGEVLSADLIVDQTPPLIELTAPARGHVEENADTVTVSGTIADNMGTVASLTFQGEAINIPADGGPFSFEFPVRYGINTMVLEARDSHGNEALKTRSVERSTSFSPQVTYALADDGTDNAMAIMLTQEAVDDDDRDEPTVDDLASLLHEIITTIDITAFVPSPLSAFNCGSAVCTFEMTNFTINKTEVSLRLMPGRIHFEARLTSPAATLAVFYPCGDNTCSIPIVGSMQSIFIETDIFLAIINGQTRVTTENTAVVLNDLEVVIADPTGIGQALLQVIVGFVEPALLESMENLFVNLIQDQLQGALGGIFDALAFDTTFDVPPLGTGTPNTIVLQTSSSGFSIVPDRLLLQLDAIAFAETPMRPATSPGVIDRRGCAPVTPLSFPPPTPITLGIHDNLLNQLLFAVWEGGSLSMDLGPNQTGDIGSDFGVSDLSLKVEAPIPPVLNSCHGEGNRAQIGDLFIEADLKFSGQTLRVAGWLQTEAQVALEVGDNEEGKLVATLILGEFDPFIFELTQNEGFFEGNDEGLIELLQGVLIPQILASLDDAMTFELPTIDLNALSDGFPEGSTIDFDVREIARDNAYLSLHGSLK